MIDLSDDQNKILKRLYVEGVLSTSGNAWTVNLEMLETLGFVTSKRPSRGGLEYVEWSLTEAGKKIVGADDA